MVDTNFDIVELKEKVGPYSKHKCYFLLEKTITTNSKHFNSHTNNNTML